MIDAIQAIVKVVNIVQEWFGKKNNQKVIDPMVEHNLRQARMLQEGVGVAMEGVVDATGVAAGAMVGLADISRKVATGEWDMADVYKATENSKLRIQDVRAAAHRGFANLDMWALGGGQSNVVPKLSGQSNVTPNTSAYSVRARGVTGTATDIPLGMLQEYHAAGVIDDATFKAYLDAQLGQMDPNAQTYDRLQRVNILDSLGKGSKTSSTTSGGGTVATVEDARQAELERLQIQNELKLITDEEYIKRLQVIYSSYQDKFSSEAHSVWRILRSRTEELARKAEQATRDELEDQTEAYEQKKMTFQEYMDFLTEKFGEATGEMAEDIAELMQATRAEKRAADAGAYTSLIQGIVEKYQSGAASFSDARLYLESLSSMPGARGEEARRALEEVRNMDIENRFRSGDVGAGEFIAHLRSQQSGFAQFTSPWVAIEERIKALQASQQDLYVTIRSDDKPDRRLRAEQGPVRSAPRGAC